MIGSFKITSSKMVAIDPGYSLSDVPLLGCALEPCRLGLWNVSESAGNTTSVPGPVVALHESAARDVSLQSKSWKAVRPSIGSDGGVRGLYDAAHFGDAQIIPVGHTFSTDRSDDPDYGTSTYATSCWRSAVGEWLSTPLDARCIGTAVVE